MRERYIKLMTTPGSHNDTYAGTCHRMFFANRENGKPLDECPDNDHHNVDTIDGLVNLPPVVFAGAKTALFAPFKYKMHFFTKTGSGQT